MEQNNGRINKLNTKKKGYYLILLFLLLGIIILVLFVINQRSNQNKKTDDSAFFYETEKTGDITLLPQQAIERNDIVIATNGATGNINPLIAVLEGDRYASGIVYESLVDIDQDGSPIPLLADHWEISEDGTTYSFTLRKDICFSDGAPVTLEDIEASITAFCDVSIESQYTQWLNYLNGYEEYRGGTSDRISGIHIEDDGISFTFLRPHFSNIWAFLVPIQKAEALSYTIGNAATYIYEGNSKNVGTGPYFFSRMRESSIELEKNENYWGEKAIIEIIYIANSNPAVVAEEFERGMTDLYSYTNQQELLLPLSENPSVNIYSYEGAVTGYIGINCRNELLSSPGVRQAMAYAVDRQSIMEEVFQNAATVPLSTYYDHSFIMPEDYNGYEYDPGNAEKLLEDEGFTKGEDGIHIKDGKRMEFTLLVNEASIYAKAAEQFAADLKEIGIQIHLNPVNFDELIKSVYEKREFDLYYGYINNSLEPSYGAQYIGKGDNNVEGWRKEEAVLLMEQIENSWNLNERKELYKEWMTLYNSEIPQIPMNSTKNYTASSAKIGQVKPNIFHTPYWNIQYYKFAE